PKQLPDGLIEAEVRGQPKPVLFLAEIATYPEKRVVEQMRADALHVVLAKGVLPEMLVVVLRPKGQYRVPKDARWTSPLGSAELSLKWNVIELWNQPAAQMLAANEVGLIPWVPLAQFSEPEEVILQKCRKRIDQLTTGKERQNFPAVTQSIVKIRFPNPALLSIFGGQQAMIESPLWVELEAEARHKDILRFLTRRFGAVPSEISDRLKPILDRSRLDALVDATADVASLDEFAKKLVVRGSRKKKS